MNKQFKSIIIYCLLLSLLIIINLTTVSYAKFYDIEYPPNSSGYTDFTDDDAKLQEEQIENEKKNENKDSEYYVGKSSNNYLKTLDIEGAKLEPEFNRQTQDYKVLLKDKNVNSINIIAETEDSKATIKGIGKVELKDGINKLQVVVTAENGNVLFYNLEVELPYNNQSELRLNSLNIEGINSENGENIEQKLKPKFEKDTFYYVINISNEISSLNVKAQADDNINISISGEDALEIGENTVIIKLSDKQDETKITSYVIKVQKSENKQSDNVNNNSYILISVVIIIIITMVIIKIFNKK